MKIQVIIRIAASLIDYPQLFKSWIKGKSFERAKAKGLFGSLVPLL